MTPLGHAQETASGGQDVSSFTVNAGLPALVDRAASALANARTAAEVLEAREAAGFAYDTAKRAARVARAKDAHDTLVSAALRAQADALTIEAQAKARLADEYDAAQERGEVASAGQYQRANVPEGNVSPATAADLGLTRKDIHEARIIRDAEVADPGIVRRTLDEALERGDEPSKARLREAVLHVARHGLGALGGGRGNPLYVKPSPASDARTRVSSCLTEIVQVAEEYAGAAILHTIEDEVARASFLRRARAVSAFLSEILETADA